MLQKKTAEELAEISEAELNKVIDEMNSAIVDYDLDGLGQILERMQKYRVSDKQRELLEKMKNAEEDFDYDALEELIRQWS